MTADLHRTGAAASLRLEGLTIQAGERVVVRDVALELRPGGIVALVGASGSGKTLTARSLLGLAAPAPGVIAARLRIEHGVQVFEPYAGIEQAVASGRLSAFRRVVDARFRPLRGALVGYLPQDARGALDPLRNVLWQVEEAMALPSPWGSDPHGATTAREWLQRAGFGNPEQVLALYPHQLSGGMAQRVSIALALARGSRFLVADEPTTGLDPTVQNEILEELRRTALQGVGILLITHDLRVVVRLASRLLIMHEGRVVESVESAALESVSSPQGRSLLEATARVGGGLLA